MTSFHHHHAPPVAPLAISVVSCTEEADALRASERNPRANGTGTVRKGTPTLTASSTPIAWKDCLFVSSSSKEEISSVLKSALPADSNCPIEPFSNLCSKFTQIVPITEKVARCYYDATAPATVALVQAKQPLASSSSSSSSSSVLNKINTPTTTSGSSSSIEPGDSCWCIVVMMPPRHTSQGIQRNRPQHSVSTSDIVNINLCVFIYDQEAIELLDSVIACCVTAAREIDAALCSDHNQTSSLGSVSAEILHHLVNVTKSIPRDLASFLPQLPESWSGALRPPHSMIPLGHFVQNFDYPALMPLFSLLCQGASVVFTHSSPAVASQCCIAVRGLLYPFAWPHHFVPIATSTECWPFPLTRNVESHSNAFIAGVATSDLPALLIDHSRTQLPCELWIADCRYGTVTRSAPTNYSSRFSINHPRIINLSLPSNVFLKDSWQRARQNMLRLTGSPKEHLRVFPDSRQDILNNVCGYWSESVIGQYRLALQPPRDTFEWDRFFYKFLLSTSLSPTGLEADPDGTIRSFAALVKNTDMFGRVFVQSIFSLEQMTHLRMNEKETTFVPFWKWGLGSVSNGKRIVKNKEHHDYYFFFRKCCEKFPNMYQDDQITAQKTKAKSGLFDKIGDAFNRAKDSVRNSISDLSIDRHFSLMIPFVSQPQSGQLPLMLKKPADEQASAPRLNNANVGLQQQQLTSSASSSALLPSSNVHNAIQYQNSNISIINPYIQVTLMYNPGFETPRVEAQCRFFPTYLRSQHWSQYYPHARDYSLKYDREQRESMNKEPLCTPLPLDLLCSFSSYHCLLAPHGAAAGAAASSASTLPVGPPPNELLRISLPNGEIKPVIISEQPQPQQQQLPFAQYPATPQASVFGKISLPPGATNTNINEGPSASTSVPQQLPDNKQQYQAQSNQQMTSLFGPSQEELEAQNKKSQQTTKTATLDDFF